MEYKRYYQNEPKFNGVFSRNNLHKIKDRAYEINLDECNSIGTHGDLKNEDIIERFTKKNCKKQIKKSLELKN